MKINTKKEARQPTGFVMAAFFQTCLTEGVAFTQIRAISNFVEPRNRENWKMQEAIQNLNEVLIELFEKRLI